MVTPSTGTGGAGGPGTPATPLQRELETTAWTEVNKAALAIVHDSIDLAFSQIDQRYSKSHIGSQTGYQARPNQPVLDHPIESTRVLQSLFPFTDEASLANYESLVYALPPDMLARFLEEGEKPLSERNPDFVALNNVLVNAARVMTYSDALSGPPSPDSLEATRTQLNLLMPFNVLNQSVLQGNDILDIASSLHAQLGSNYRYSDDLLDITTQSRSSLDNLSQEKWQTLMGQEGGITNA